MGLWIAAAVLLVLAILSLGVRIRYNEAGFFLKVIAGPVKITVFPRKKKRKKRSAFGHHAHFGESWKRGERW